MGFYNKLYFNCCFPTLCKIWPFHSPIWPLLFIGVSASFPASPSQKQNSEISMHITLGCSRHHQGETEKKEEPKLTAFYSPTCRVNKLFLSCSCKSANSVQKRLAGRNCPTIPNGGESEGLQKCFLLIKIWNSPQSVCYSKSMQFYTNDPQTKQWAIIWH